MNQAEQMREAAAECALQCKARDMNIGLHGSISLMRNDINAAIRALPLPEPTPDARNDALAKASEALKPFACIAETIARGVPDQWLLEGAYRDGVFQGVTNGDFRRGYEALAAINTALSTDSPKPDALAKAKEALSRLIAACDAGRRFERGVGGMTTEAQLKRTRISDVSAWEVEEAREALALIEKPKGPAVALTVAEVKAWADDPQVKESVKKIVHR